MSDMVLVLRINCAGAAFGDEDEYDMRREFARILRTIADHIVGHPGYASTFANLRDINGNTCGTVGLKSRSYWPDDEIPRA